MFSGFRAVAEYASDKWHLPATTVYAELRSEFESGNRMRTFNAWLSSRHLEPTGTAEELIDVYRNHAPQIEMFAGMRELLNTTAEESRMGLVSDGFLKVQRRKFAALQIDDLFECVVFSDQWGREHWKPAERPYREALRALDVIDPTETVYVGDNPSKDFVTPRALGMYSIQVRYSPAGFYDGRVAPSPEHEPHEVVGSVDELSSSLR